MKKLIVVLAILFASCSASSDDDCVGNRNEIEERYAKLIELSGNETEIESLLNERNIALQNACD